MNSLKREKGDTKEFRRLVLCSFGKGRRETQKEFRRLVLGEFFLAKGERKKKIDSRNKFYQTPTVKDVVGRRTFVGSAKCSACARRVLNLIYLRIYPKCNRVKSVNEGNNDRKRRNRYRGNYRVGVYE